MKLKDSYHLYAGVTVLCWSLAYALTRLSLSYFSPFNLACLRYSIASAVLIPFAIFAKVKLPRLKDMPWFIAAGAAGYFVYMIVFNTAAGMVNAATGSTVITSVPVVTAILARLFYKEKLKLYQWVAVGIEFAGILLLLLEGDSFSLNSGVLWLMVCSLLLSSYNLLQRRLSKTYTSLQAAIYSIFTGTLMLQIFAPGAITQAAHAAPVAWVYLIVLGVLSSAVAYVTWTIALSKTEKTSYVSNYMFITPLLATIWGYLLGHEVPEWSTLTGGVVMISGALLFYRDNFKRSTKQEPLPEAADTTVPG